MSLKVCFIFLWKGKTLKVYKKGGSCLCGPSVPCGPTVGLQHFCYWYHSLSCFSCLMEAQASKFGPTDPALLSAALNINTLLRGPVNTRYRGAAMNVRTNLRISPMCLRVANGAVQEEKCKRDPCNGKGKGFEMTSHSCKWFWLHFYCTLKLLHYNNVFHFQQVFMFTQNSHWRQLSSVLSFSFTSSSKWSIIHDVFISKIRITIYKVVWT